MLKRILHRDLAVESPILTTEILMPYLTSVARAYTSGESVLPFRLAFPASTGECTVPSNDTQEEDPCFPAPRDEDASGSGAASP